jgi:nucleotide-binding universal stress UspA family protein
MKKPEILIPTDLTELGNAAFRHAAQFISQFGGKVQPVFVYEGDEESDRLLGLNRIVELRKESGQQRIENFINERSREHLREDQLYPPLVVVGKASDEIIKAAKDKDFIIMSGNKRAGMARIALGSTAQRVAAASGTPVIVTCSSCRLDPLDKLLILTDGSEPSRECFPIASKMMQKLPESRAELVHFIHVGYFTTGNHEKAIQKAEELLEEMRQDAFSEVKDRVETKVFITSTSTSEAILNLCASRDYSLCMLTSRGHSRLKNVILGGTAGAVLRGLDVPVLSFKPQK